MPLPFSGHIRWNVMQKVSVRVELRAVTSSERGSHTRLKPARVVPPRTGSLAWIRDHGIHQNKFADRGLATYKRGRESAKRLGDEHHVTARTEGCGDKAHIFGQPCGFIVPRQVNGYRLVPGSLEQRDHTAPVPGRATGARDQNEHTHVSARQDRRLRVILSCYRRGPGQEGAVVDAVSG